MRGALRSIFAVASALMASVCGVADAAAQVAQPAPGRGVQVPQAYYERIATDPRAFTLPSGLFTTGPEGAPQPAVQLGAKKMVVIPALFSDSPDPQFSATDIQQILFDGPAPRGTLTQAYEEFSRGKFTVSGDVHPWVRTSLTLSEVVGSESGLGSDARVGEYLVEALQLVDGDVDFGAYDNDGPDGIPNSGDDDGYVDAIAFEFIEVAGSCGGPGIWPHLWGIAPQNGGQPYYTDDLRPDGTPVKVNPYIVQSAVDCSGGNIQDAATIAHEFGHVLGLPDYYHPTLGGDAYGRRWVLGCWELMAAGSWGCGVHGTTRGPFGPTHLSARSKNSLGWLDYVTVPRVRDEEIVLDPVQQSGQALRIPLDDAGNEFLLVEYRSRTGFDRDLPADGVLVYHQDFNGSLRPTPGSGEPYFLSVLEQDDNDGLVRDTYEGGNRGEAGDAWGVDGVEDKLNGETSPSTRLDDGTASSVTFHSIVVKDGKAYLRVSTAPTPEIVAPTEPLTVTEVVSFEERLRIAGGYMPYTVTGSVPDGVLMEAQGDEVVLSGSVTG
ncbi:MAG: M6 family metalloprotease domain-containing protein, partial [Gemmatimonadota bacterium]